MRNFNNITALAGGVRRRRGWGVGWPPVTHGHSVQPEVHSGGVSGAVGDLFLHAAPLRVRAGQRPRPSRRCARFCPGLEPQLLTGR